jgi:hypothetical protein
MNAFDRFDGFFDRFQSTEMWTAMLNTREDSPWHREENVAVHTRMLIKWYKENLAHQRNERQNLLTLVSCLFHDVGKPPAQIVKFSEERGEYRAYHGHEQLSARMWVDYAMTNFEMVHETLRFDLSDVSNIAFFVEHHVPFAMKDSRKRKALKSSLLERTGSSGHQAWLDFLMSDQHGRISDDQATKLAAVDQWMKEWKEV